MAERKDATLSECNKVIQSESNMEAQNGSVSIEGPSSNWRLRKICFKKNCAIFCGLLYYFLLGVEETIMSAYFPVVAKKRGLNSFEIGLAYTMMEVSNFGFSFVVMYAIKPKTEKLFFVAGVFVNAIASAATGCLQWVYSGELFLVLSCVFEFILGIGTAMSLSTAIPLMTTLSLKNAGKITAWAEALLSLGGLVGPPLGSVLYHFYDFCLPSFVAAGLLFACGMASYTFLSISQTSSSLSPTSSSTSNKSSSRDKLSESSSLANNNEDTSDNSISDNHQFDPLAYFKFILKPNLLLVSTLGIIVAAQITFFEVCLSLYLDEVFGLNTVEIGLLFLALSLSNVAMVPVYGVAIDKGFAVQVMLVTSLGFSFSFFVLYLPDLFPSLQSIWFISAVFVISGFFAAGAFVPAYLVYEKISQINGFNNLPQLKLLVATWCNNLYAIGALIGSLLLAGPVYEEYGFNFTSLVIALIMFLCTVLCIFCIYNMGLFKRIFYLDSEDDTSSADIILSSSNQDADELPGHLHNRLEEEKLQFSALSHNAAESDGASNSNKLNNALNGVHFVSNRSDILKPLASSTDA